MDQPLQSLLAPSNQGLQRIGAGFPCEARQIVGDEFDPARRIILHCASGGRSALAVATMQELGYTKVAHMDGGFKAWKASGRPLEGGGA